MKLFQGLFSSTAPGRLPGATVPADVMVPHARAGRILSSGAGAGPQLAFQIVNSAGRTVTDDVVFITDDATYNQVSLQIQLTVGSTQLTPGTIPDPSAPPQSGSTVYVDLSGLRLTADVWAALSFGSADWQFAKFPDQGVFGMTPKKPLTLSAGTAGAIAVDISGIVVPKPLPAPQAQLYASSYGILGGAAAYAAFSVALQRRPDGGEDLSQVLSVSLSANGIVNSPSAALTARNAFGLQLSGKPSARVVAGPDTVFTVGFAYGAPHDPYGFGALTDPASARDIDAKAGLNADAWSITRDGAAQSPYWTLKPPAGAPIVGTGTQSIVQIDFSKVVTAYQPGPTVMLISYASVPGYRDGAFALLLDKVAHASIDGLGVDPNPARFSGGSAQVQVSWSAMGARSLELTQNYQTRSVTGLTGVSAVLDAEKTVFLLRATGAPGTVENVDMRSVQAIALPVVNGFSGAPTEIFSGSASHDAVFRWSIDSSDGVKLTSTGRAFSEQVFSNPTGSNGVLIAEPQMLTLAPVTAARPLSLTRRLVVSAFTPLPRTYPLGFAPAAVGVSPSGPFVLVGSADGAGLTALDTVRYARIGSVPTGRSATSIAFSADGALAATANGDSSVSIFGVRTGPDGLPTFGAPATVKLAGTARALVFAPKGSRLFVTVDAGPGQPGQVASVVAFGEGYRIEATVTVGAQPNGLALDAAGARLFVANGGDDTLSMIGLTSGGGLGEPSTVHGLAGRPAGIAATPSGEQLLVSCADAGTVVVLDPNHPETGQRTTLVVGKGAGQVVVTPGGAYAFVVDGSQGTVALVDSWGMPSCASVLRSITVGSQPSGIAISPDGLQVLVATADGLTVVTLATYQATSQSPALPNRPTHVEPLSDGSAVLAWHDASIPAVAPCPGILVYGLTSRMASNVLADENVLRCVASPDPLARQAFAIVRGDPTLHVIDTQTLEVSEASLGLAPGASPVALAVTGDGGTVCVVAADGSQGLSLVVLGPSGEQLPTSWAPVAVVPLYQATQHDRFLLRATLDGSTLFLVDTVAARVRVLRQSGRSYVLSSTVLEGDAGAVDLAILPDGSKAYLLNAGARTNTVTVIDVATLDSRVVAIPQEYVNLTALQPSPDGRRLFAPDANAAAIRVLDPFSLRILQTIPLQGQPSGTGGLAVAPDGSRLLVAHALSQDVSVVEQIQMGPGLARGAGPVLGATAGPMLGDAYSGLFVRHSLGDTPTSPGDGWAGSPDIILNGTTIAQDPTVFATSDDYNNNDHHGASGAAEVVLLNPNYVYLRGLNTTGQPHRARIYFYFTPGGLALWPGNWWSNGIQVNGVPQNWIDVSADPIGGASNGVGVSSIPLVWTPGPLPAGSDHYCVVGWVDDSSNPQPPPLASYAAFGSLEELIAFILSHHNLAWRNTHEVVAAEPYATACTGLELGEGGGTVFLNVAFPNARFDDPEARFSVLLQGDSPRNTVKLDDALLTDYQGGFSPREPLVFGSRFKTSVQVAFWTGKYPVPSTMRIRITLTTTVGPALQARIETRCRAMGRPSPLRNRGRLKVAVIGSTTFDFTVNAKKGDGR